MLGPPRRKQDSYQRENDVDSQIGNCLVGARGNIERERNDKDRACQSEDGPAELQPPIPTSTRDRGCSRNGLNHRGLAVFLIIRA